MSALIVEHAPILHRSTCPSCGAETSFQFLGIQRWPEKVAESLGLPAEQSMWQCSTCHTSLMEESIKIQTVQGLMNG